MPELSDLNVSATPRHLQFNSIVLDIFAPRATLDSTRFDLDPQKFLSYLLSVSKIWREITHQAKVQACRNIQLEGLSVETIIGYIQRIITAVEEGSHQGGYSRDALLDLSARQMNLQPMDIEVVALLRFSAYVWSMCLVDIPTRIPHRLEPQHWISSTFSLQRQIEELRPIPPNRPHGIEFQPSFRLFDLENISRFEVFWVNDIFQHLTLSDRSLSRDDGALEIKIFHHRRFLEFHKDVRSNVFPDGFVEETLRTLDLLLPGQHKQTQRWYRRRSSKLGLDSTACKSGIVLRPYHRKIDNYEFWAERLCILKETFDQLEPDNVTRFWRDKRKPVQWATFWVAVLVLILTIFFGLVQSIEGALQVYKAYNPS